MSIGNCSNMSTTIFSSMSLPLLIDGTDKTDGQTLYTGTHR